MSAERAVDPDVLIQGAGIGGLTLAIAIIQKNYTVRIVERASGLSEVGAGSWMAANPMQVFDRFGFADKITADVRFCVAPEEHAVRQDAGAAPRAFERTDDMEQVSVVALLPRRRSERFEAFVGVAQRIEARAPALI